MQNEIEQRHIGKPRQKCQAAKEEAGIIAQRPRHHRIIGIKLRVGPLLEKWNLDRLIPHPHAIAGEQHLHDRQQNRRLKPENSPDNPA